MNPSNERVAGSKGEVDVCELENRVQDGDAEERKAELSESADDVYNFCLLQLVQLLHHSLYSLYCSYSWCCLVPLHAVCRSLAVRTEALRAQPVDSNCQVRRQIGVASSESAQTNSAGEAQRRHETAEKGQQNPSEASSWYLPLVPEPTCKSDRRVWAYDKKQYSVPQTQSHVNK